MARPRSDNDVFRAIADPTRRELLDRLAAGEESMTKLAESFSMSLPAVSQHLKVLRDAGLVEVRRDAQRRLYRLRAEPLRELDAWLEPYRALWSTALDDLERHLDDH